MYTKRYILHYYSRVLWIETGFVLSFQLKVIVEIIYII